MFYVRACIFNLIRVLWNYGSHSLSRPFYPVLLVGFPHVCVNSDFLAAAGAHVCFQSVLPTQPPQDGPTVSPSTRKMATDVLTPVP